MAGVAVIHHRTGGYSVRNRCEFVFGFQPVGLGIIKFRAVDIHGAGNVAVGLSGWRLFLAKEK